MIILTNSSSLIPMELKTFVTILRTVSDLVYSAGTQTKVFRIAASIACSALSPMQSVLSITHHNKSFPFILTKEYIRYF